MFIKNATIDVINISSFIKKLYTSIEAIFPDWTQFEPPGGTIKAFKQFEGRLIGGSIPLWTP